jgi:flagellar biosynthesis protein FlhG
VQRAVKNARCGKFSEPNSWLDESKQGWCVMNKGDFSNRANKSAIVTSGVSGMKNQEVTRVISFTSGKGGVGKSHTVTNMAISLASQGLSVLLLDADLGLANVDVLLGLKPKGTLHDVLKGSGSLDDILLEGPGGITIIPAASGVEEIQALRAEEKMLLLEEIERVAHRFDYLLIDTPAGISSDVMYFNSAAAEVVCVITGEPTSLTDSYALIKVLSAAYGEKDVSVVVNNIGSEEEARTAFNKLARAVERFLRVEVRYLGWIPSDAVVRECIMRQRPVSLEFPSSKAAVALSGVARRLESERPVQKVKGGMQFFFRQLLELTSYGEESRY